MADISIIFPQTTAEPPTPPIYIPPNGISFRLINKSSNNVLVSRLGTQPEVCHHPSRDVFDAQYFALLRGSGPQDGKYAVKSNVTRRVLFSRRGQEPFVSHIAGDGRYQDNWHEFQPGKGDRVGWFRIITPLWRVALVSRNYVVPHVFNDPVEEICEDQYWRFDFEPVEAVGVEWDLATATVETNRTECAADVMVENNRQNRQSFSWTFTQDMAWSGFATRLDGFPLGTDVTVTSGLPTLAGGKLVVDEKLARWKLGTPISIALTRRGTRSFQVAPLSTAHAFAMATHAKIDVPFMLHLRGRVSGAEATMRGMWRGTISGHYTPFEIHNSWAL